MIKLLYIAVVIVFALAHQSEATPVKIDLSLNVSEPTAPPLFGVIEATTLVMSFIVDSSDANLVAAGDTVNGRIFSENLYGFDRDDVIFSSVTYGNQSWTTENLQTAGLIDSLAGSENVLVVSGGLTPFELNAVSFRLVDIVDPNSGISNRMDWGTSVTQNSDGTFSVSEIGTISDGNQLAVLTLDNVSIDTSFAVPEVSATGSIAAFGSLLSFLLFLWERRRSLINAKT